MMLRRLAIACLVALFPALATAQIAYIAPTAPNGDSSDRIANTAWVLANSGGGSQPALPSGQIWIGSVGNVATGQTPSGDLTVNNAGVFTFGVVNANVGTFGSATQCPTVTVNAKGLVTAASQNLCAPGIANVTGLGAGVATALGINTGTAGSFVVNGGALGTPSSGVATNLTGTAAGLTAGNVTTNANLTGAITSTGNATSLGSFTSAQLLAALTTKTGTGNAVFGTAPTIDSLNATTAATLAFITGSTQCLQVNSSGAISGTGSACGGSGSTGANPTATASDTAVNGVATTYMRSDAAPAVQKASNAQFGVMEGDNVTVTCTAGVCGQKATTLTNSIGANVAMNNTANYFDGPSVAQGTSGTWLGIGTVTVTDSAGAAGLLCKLWDGTTVIASSFVNITAATLGASFGLSGPLSSPAGNIRISCRDITSTNGSILFNNTGLSKDSTVTAYRIQ